MCIISKYVFFPDVTELLGTSFFLLQDLLPKAHPVFHQWAPIA